MPQTDSGEVDVNTPIAPSVIHNNFPDPDAEALDSQFRDAAEPPNRMEVAKATHRIVETPDSPKPQTRLLTGTLIGQTTWAPVCLMTSDVNRKQLRISATSATATDTVLFSDDAGKVQQASSAHTLLVGAANGVTFDHHNGPVWISLVGTGPITVTFIAVTE